MVTGSREYAILNEGGTVWEVSRLRDVHESTLWWQVQVDTTLMGAPSTD